MRLPIPLLASSLLACLGCGPTPLTGVDLTSRFEGIVRTRASLEFPCGADTVSVDDLGGYAYRATGCGYFAEYECNYGWARGDSSDGVVLYVCQRAARDNATPLDGGGD